MKEDKTKAAFELKPATSILRNVRTLALLLVTMQTILSFIVIWIIWAYGFGNNTLALIETMLVSFLSISTIFVVLTMLDRISRLVEMIKVCAWTRRVEVNGEWIPMEEYLTRHLGIMITHGISKEAAMRVREDLKASEQEISSQTPPAP